MIEYNNACNCNQHLLFIQTGKLGNDMFYFHVLTVNQNKFYLKQYDTNQSTITFHNKYFVLK